MTMYDEKAVPVLYRGPGQKIGLSEEAHDTVEKAKASAQRAIDDKGVEAYDKHYLTGHSVIVDYPNGAGSQFPDGAGGGRFVANVGAETLDEALKSVISAVDLSHIHPRDESSDHLYPPNWVASTHKQLGELLADYYSCDLRDMSEVL